MEGRKKAQEDDKGTGKAHTTAAAEDKKKMQDQASQDRKKIQDQASQIKKGMGATEQSQRST